MSKFSGKCDFYDHLCMGHNDLLEAFEEFKRKSGGVLYQHVLIREVNEWNQDFIKAHCPQFDYQKHVWQDPDKRYKCGFKEVVTYTYTYHNKNYTLKEINKKGVYITKEIPFNTLLDLVPYFPYVVSACCSSKDLEIVYLSNKSYVDRQEDEFFKHGIDSEGPTHYRKKLADAYLEICKDYFLKDVEERTKIVPLTDIFEDQVKEGDTSW